MLIHVNKNYFARGKTGKGKFAGRLVRAWREMGVEITEDPKRKADIALHIGRMNYESWAKKHVLRVGPACIDTNMDWRKINHEKAKSVKKADAIIYQSLYSKKVYHKLVYNPDKPEAIIFNGADPNEPVAGKDGFIRQLDHYFLASTRVWLKQKRLKYIVKAFDDFRSSKVESSGLIICGEIPSRELKKYKKVKNVYCLGNVYQMLLERLYRECTAMVHITWIDACPNSVVEALVAGLPVICTNQGGTHELIWSSKKDCECDVIRHDSMFKYKPVDLNKPPHSNRLIEMLVENMHGQALRNNRVKYENLYIQNIAQQYLQFFEGLL